MEKERQEEGEEANEMKEKSWNDIVCQVKASFMHMLQANKNALINGACESD